MCAKNIKCTDLPSYKTEMIKTHRTCKGPTVQRRVRSRKPDFSVYKHIPPLTPESLKLCLITYTQLRMSHLKLPEDVASEAPCGCLL